jgi:hypothetical protein
MKRTYRILEGVRRAKSAQLAGQAAIWAEMAGRENEDERKIDVGSLLSPKKYILLDSPRERDRWISIRDGMAQEPDLFPPIIVKPSTRGVPIKDVGIIDEGASR